MKPTSIIPEPGKLIERSAVLVDSRWFRRMVCAFLALVVWTMTCPAIALTIELSGAVKLRPQDTDQALNAGRKTILLDDETLRTTAMIRFSSAAEKVSFSNSFPVLVLQSRGGASNTWQNIHTFFDNTAARAALPGAGTSIISPQPKPLSKIENLEIQPNPNINVPQDPNKPPAIKTGPPFDSPSTTASPPSGLTFNSTDLTLPAGTVAIRASARRADGTSVESPALPLEVRAAPPVLTLFAMGGTCTDPDGNTNDQNLTDAGITRNNNICASKGVQPTFIGALTSPSSVNCNNPCNTGCTNFFEHLALRTMNDRKLANEFDSINNPGTQMCDRRTNSAGIRNHIIFGKWRNTEEEPVCGTSTKFNTIIDNFVNQGGKSLILVGQSQGGAKLAGMVRDHWRWGNDITLELIVLWDATSFDVISFDETGHLGVDSMGVRRVGSKPLKTISFYQYSDLLPFQNGAPPLDSAERHDLDGCFSHDGIARSQFVHQRTADAVKEAIQVARNRARS